MRSILIIFIDVRRCYFMYSALIVTLFSYSFISCVVVAIIIYSHASIQLNSKGYRWTSLEILNLDESCSGYLFLKHHIVSVSL